MTWYFIATFISHTHRGSSAWVHRRGQLISRGILVVAVSYDTVLLRVPAKPAAPAHDVQTAATASRPRPRSHNFRLSYDSVCMLTRSIGHALRKQTAGQFGPDLAKKLSQLVKMEKNVMRSMELVGRERMEVAQQLSIWGEACDDDVSDVTDKLGVLLYEIGELEDQYVDRYDQYRVTIKSIRNIEASVQPSRDRKQKITDQIAQLKYKEPNSPKIVVLEQELVRAEAESLVAEAQLSNITREKLKAAYTYQFDALREHCEKLAIIAGFGKHLLELVDDTPVTPGETRAAYDGYEASKAIIQDCEDALTNWVTANAKVSSNLSTRARTLSQRRRNNIQRNAEGHDLSGQDQPLNDRESGLWVPASAHKGDEFDDDEEEEEEVGAPSIQDSALNGESRGRTEEVIA
ncbi:Sphingolipid long chain base-responsive protein [Lachnellula willkommii]|uniref:Sphingolipid long chain base-responsive protein n=1 Tax=Lachnellula willkommii TaxID=215461 RepID=A0A559M5W4_9HELO|nr:Sphingolipid long chain base-responsive protein [Lachnellula willkommii]